MNVHLKLLCVCALLMAGMRIANAQCPSVSPAFRDLEDWVHSNVQNGVSHNYIEIHVTIVNPVGLTVWGKGRFMQGVSGYGQCVLATNPTIPLYFSDRVTAITGTDNHGNSGNNLRQPFSTLAWDKHIVSLDMVNSTITNKSLSWNATSSVSNVVRKGNVVYGADNNGALIVLTLLKRTFTGAVAPPIEP